MVVLSPNITLAPEYTFTVLASDAKKEAVKSISILKLSHTKVNTINANDISCLGRRHLSASGRLRSTNSSCKMCVLEASIRYLTVETSYIYLFIVPGPIYCNWTKVLGTLRRNR